MLYGLAVSARNAAYESKLVKSTSFNLPVISVGNLSIGGTGKTPMVEWLIEKISPFLTVAVLSRGYSRKTKGYRKVTGRENAKAVGDESLQLKRKYPSVAVAVSESRTLGLASLLMDHPGTQLVLLDDAFQHRSIQPGLNILMTEFRYPYFEDHLMPIGRLREWRSASARADILIVSKCPAELSEKDAYKFKLNASEITTDNIYFTIITYSHCYSMNDYNRVLNTDIYDALLLVNAIGRPEYLSEYFDNKVDKIYNYDFGDHHQYTHKDVQNIINSFRRIPILKKAMVTTEKDIVKLMEYRLEFENNNIEIFIQQVGQQFLFEQEDEFEKRIKEFLLNFKR